MNKVSKASHFHSISNFLLSFGFLVIGLGISSFVLFNGVKLTIKDNPYRSVLHITMFPYFSYHFGEIDEQPFPYLLTIVLISAVIGALWITFIAPKYTRHIKRQVLAIPWISLIITSPFWGLIWSANRWPAEGFASYETMMLFRRTDAMSGLGSGWLSAIQSFPINILSYIAFCLLLFAARKLFSNEVSERAMSSLNEKPA